eukprot:jgi/Mesvir1/16858/Mv15744-RA.2
MDTHATASTGANSGKDAAKFNRVGSAEVPLSVTSREAHELFLEKKYGECLALLEEIRKKKGDYPKVLLNIALVEYYHGDCSDPHKLLKALASVKAKCEELARSAELQLEGVASVPSGGASATPAGSATAGAAPGVGASASSSSTSTAATSSATTASKSLADAGASTSLVTFMQEYDTSLASLNMAVVLYQMQRYGAAIAMLEPLYGNLEPIDELVALRICLLLLELYLITRNPDKAAGILAYIEKAFCYQLQDPTPGARGLNPPLASGGGAPRKLLTGATSSTSGDSQPRAPLGNGSADADAAGGSHKGGVGGKGDGGGSASTTGDGSGSLEGGDRKGGDAGGSSEDLSLDLAASFGELSTREGSSAFGSVTGGGSGAAGAGGDGQGGVLSPGAVTSASLSTTSSLRSLEVPSERRLQLHLLKARLQLLMHNMKGTKKEIKAALNLTNDENKCALFLKAQLEFTRHNYRKSLKLLLAAAAPTSPSPSTTTPSLPGLPAPLTSTSDNRVGATAVTTTGQTSGSRNSSTSSSASTPAGNTGAGSLTTTTTSSTSLPASCAPVPSSSSSSPPPLLLYPAFLSNMGCIHAHLGKHTTALLYFTKALASLNELVGSEGGLASGLSIAKPPSSTSSSSSGSASITPQSGSTSSAGAARGGTAAAPGGVATGPPSNGALPSPSSTGGGSSSSPILPPATPRFCLDRRMQVLYNLGLQHLLAGARPLLALRCFQESARLFHHSPLLWLRMAECCVLVHSSQQWGCTPGDASSAIAPPGQSGWLRASGGAPETLGGSNGVSKDGRIAGGPEGAASAATAAGGAAAGGTVPIFPAVAAISFPGDQQRLQVDVVGRGPYRRLLLSLPGGRGGGGAREDGKDEDVSHAGDSSNNSSSNGSSAAGGAATSSGGDAGSGAKGNGSAGDRSKGDAGGSASSDTNSSSATGANASHRAGDAASVSSSSSATGGGAKGGDGTSSGGAGSGSAAIARSGVAGNGNAPGGSNSGAATLVPLSKKLEVRPLAAARAYLANALYLLDRAESSAPASSYDGSGEDMLTGVHPGMLSLAGGGGAASGPGGGPLLRGLGMGGTLASAGASVGLDGGGLMGAGADGRSGGGDGDAPSAGGDAKRTGVDDGSSNKQGLAGGVDGAQTSSLGGSVGSSSSSATAAMASASSAASAGGAGGPLFAALGAYCDARKRDLALLRAAVLTNLAHVSLCLDGEAGAPSALAAAEAVLKIALPPGPGAPPTGSQAGSNDGAMATSSAGSAGFSGSASSASNSSSASTSSSSSSAAAAAAAVPSVAAASLTAFRSLQFTARLLAAESHALMGRLADAEALVLACMQDAAGAAPEGPWAAGRGGLSAEVPPGGRAPAAPGGGRPGGGPAGAPGVDLASSGDARSAMGKADLLGPAARSALLVNLASVYALQGDMGRARVAAAQAYALHPSSGAAHAALVYAELALGQTDAALALLKYRRTAAMVGGGPRAPGGDGRPTRPRDARGTGGGVGWPDRGAPRRGAVWPRDRARDGVWVGRAGRGGAGGHGAWDWVCSGCALVRGGGPGRDGEPGGHEGVAGGGARGPWPRPTPGRR